MMSEQCPANIFLEIRFPHVVFYKKHRVKFLTCKQAFSIFLLYLEISFSDLT